MSARIIPVPCLRDNYAYLVVEGSRALCVDPSEPEPVERALAQEGLLLAAILCTHHHHDHVGGNLALCAARPGMPVYAHASDRGRVPGQTHAAQEGASFELLGMSIAALHVPGHTLGAVSYCLADVAFTGDTLFVAGCGRLFEGTADMMHASLAKIAALPAPTRLFCGHEYTVRNLEFALTVEPDNRSAVEKLAWARAERAANRPTVPTTVADELATNPFVRCRPEDFARVRAAKDVF